MSSSFSVVVLTAHPTARNDTTASMTKIDGREALLRSVELFLNRDAIKQILLIVSQAASEEAKRKFGAHLGFTGVKLVTSGAEWFEQLAGASEKLDPTTSHVLIHDAARPCVAYTDLDALIASAPKHPAVGLAIAHRGVALEAASVPGEGKIVAQRTHELVTPLVMDKSTFATVTQTKSWPTTLQVLESSPLNRRAGDLEPSILKAMINLLPKPKIKAPSNPFEEAQW